MRTHGRKARVAPVRGTALPNGAGLTASTKTAGDGHDRPELVVVPQRGRSGAERRRAGFGLACPSLLSGGVSRLDRKLRAPARMGGRPRGPKSAAIKPVAAYALSLAACRAWPTGGRKREGWKPEGTRRGCGSWRSPRARSARGGLAQRRLSTIAIRCSLRSEVRTRKRPSAPPTNVTPTRCDDSLSSCVVCRSRRRT